MYLLNNGPSTAISGILANFSTNMVCLDEVPSLSLDFLETDKHKMTDKCD